VFSFHLPNIFILLLPFIYLSFSYPLYTLIFVVFQRLSAVEALDHPWLTKGPAAAVELSTIRADLMRFNATRRLRKAVLAIVAMNHIKVRDITFFLFCFCFC
jgi:hypothetical protein